MRFLKLFISSIIGTFPLLVAFWVFPREWAIVYGYFVGFIAGQFLKWVYKNNFNTED